MKKLSVLIIACLVIFLTGCCQKVAIKVKEPSCPDAIKPVEEKRIDGNYFDVIEYSHDLETQVNCYKIYFKELNK